MTMNACVEQGVLELHHDGELDEVRSRELEAHLAACAHCRTRLEALGRLRELVRGSAAAPLAPEQMVDRLLERWAEERSGAALGRIGARFAAAAALLLLVTGSMLLNRTGAEGGADMALWEALAVVGGEDAPEPEDPEGVMARWILADLSGGNGL